MFYIGHFFPTEMLQLLPFLEYKDIKICKLSVRFEQLCWNYNEPLSCHIEKDNDVFSCDLPYKSDEMVHVAFPDERYNKSKHSNMQRWSLRHSTHVNGNSSCGAAFTVNGAADTHVRITYRHANN